MPKDDYVQQRAVAARWIYDRKHRPMWWRWSVLTKHNTDPETFALSDTIAWNIFTDLAKRDLLVPCMGDDGFEAFKLNLRPNDAWKVIMHPPGFPTQYLLCAIGFGVLVPLILIIAMMMSSAVHKRRAAEKQAAAQKQADQDGYQAFKDGIDEPPYENAKFWQAGWKRAELDERRADEAAERKALEQVRLKQEAIEEEARLVEQKKIWVAGEAVLKATYYKSSQYREDIETLREIYDRGYELFSLQAKVAHALSHKMDQDRWKAVKETVSPYGIADMDEWINLENLAQKHEW